MSEKVDVIVSLTTWKMRINEPTLPVVLMSLITQKTQFNHKVVLVLSREEFGYDYQLPKNIEFLTNHPKFEVLWTYKNTKALKKLNPVMQKYPDVPIITLDDDILAEQNTVENMMQDHLKTPKHILGGICDVYNGILRVAYIRLFPPHSLIDIPEEYFIQYFNALNDDEWNGMRAILNNTIQRKLSFGAKLMVTYGSQENALGKEHGKFKFKEAYKKFIIDHPEYDLKNNFHEDSAGI